MSFLVPRAYAYMGSVFLPSWDIEVEQTAYGTADTMRIQTPLASAPMDFGAFMQANTDPIPLIVNVGAQTDPAAYNASSFQELEYGFVDETESDYETDVIEFRGRGVLALLVDDRTTARLDMNIDVGTAIAQLINKVGLTAQVGTAGVLVGKVLQEDYVAVSRNYRTLELMQLLANGVGWNIRAIGRTIKVGPPPDPKTVPTITKTHGAGGDIGLKVRHSALHAHDITVKVVSYVPRTKQRVSTSSTTPVTDPLTGQSLQLPVSTPPSKARLGSTGGRQSGVSTGNFHFSRQEEYVFHIPNLTQDECDRRAALIQAEISRHEFVIDMTFTPTLDDLKQITAASPEFLINLRGCSQSSHNQLYHPRRVTWNWTLEEGIKINVLGVNHDVPTNTGGE